MQRNRGLKKVKNPARSSNLGMTLIEVVVAMVIGTAVSLLAYRFYQKFVQGLAQQKQISSLQDGIRNASECINRFLIAGGVSGDSLFFDPHKKLSADIVNGGHRVFDVNADSSTLSVYGNFTGSAASLASPVVDKTIRSVKTDKPWLFKAGGYAYIYAGSAQEVANILSISDSTLNLADDFFAPYPKGTLIFPLERIRVSLVNTKTLRVSRESPNGVASFVREFTPTDHVGDSLNFKVKTVDKKAGQISYALAFTAKAGAPPHLVLARQSDQTIFVRGF